MNKLLITGSSSFLGWNLCNYAKDEFEVFGSVLKHSSGLDHVKEINTDLTDPQACIDLINKVKPDGIIHNAAFSKPDKCETDPDYSKQLNVHCSDYLSKEAAKQKIAFCFISTDLVYKGDTALSDEETPVDPISIYGKHKVEAEKIVLNNSSKFTVFRCPLMYGFSETPNKGYFHEFYNKMKVGESLNLFIDEYRSQALASEVAKGIVDLFTNGSSGIFNMGGPQRISRFEFGMLMKSVLNLESAKVVPANQNDFPSKAPRASDTSMDISKAMAKGYNPSPPMLGLLNLREFLDPKDPEVV